MSGFREGLFASKVAIVTGGGTGIGFGVAKALIALGAKVALMGRRAEVLAEAASKLGHDALAIPTDIRDPEVVARSVGAVVNRLGAVDVLVNNAGGQFPAPAEAISPKGFEAVIRNNLVGTFQVIRQVALGGMLERGGAVVNVTANVARGFPGMSHTGAARAGVENLTRSLAVEWISRGIRVNAVAPGIIDTPALRSYPDGLAEHVISRLPSGRPGTIEEVVAPIVFLASPLASYVTGTVLPVDGAAHLWGDSWTVEPPASGKGL